MTDSARGFNRCRWCGAFRPWDDLEQGGGHYMASIYGDVEEDFYMVCRLGRGCRARGSTELTQENPDE